MSWGSSPWGSSSWGGGPGGALDLVAAIIVRDNVVRLEFNAKVYLSHLLDPEDAVPEKFSAVPVPGTKGWNDSDARPVRLVKVEYSTESDGVPIEANGFFLSVTTDRPFTPFPAQYEFTVRDIYEEGNFSNTLAEKALLADSTYRILQRPKNDAPSTSRDFANPQTIRAAQGVSAQPALAKLGTYLVDDTGDYAYDDIQTGRRKRIVRRIVTRKNAFAHLTGYGVGVGAYGKKLASVATVSALLADIEAQLLQEPDIRTVKAKLIRDRARPGLYRIDVAVQPKVGKASMFQVPFASE